MSSNKQTETEGVILRGVGGNYAVDCGGRTLRCRAGGRLRLTDEVPAVGDRVTVLVSGGTGYIVEIRPRRNALERPAVTNIDNLCIFVAEAPPVTDLYFADQLTVAALARGIRPIILVAKCDLASGEALAALYRAADFEVCRVSAVSGEGVEELRTLLQGGVSAFAGNSGVGKSSLLNRLEPGLTLQTGDISRIQRGKHTTRSASLLPLTGGGYVVDTPGFSVFEALDGIGLRKEQLQHLFPEIAPLFGGCRFADCLHRAEPDCAVRRAVEEGRIARSRYESYLKMLEELERRPIWA